MHQPIVVQASQVHFLCAPPRTIYATHPILYHREVRHTIMHGIHRCVLTSLHTYMVTYLQCKHTHTCLPADWYQTKFHEAHVIIDPWKATSYKGYQGTLALASFISTPAYKYIHIYILLYKCIVAKAPCKPTARGRDQGSSWRRRSCLSGACVVGGVWGSLYWWNTYN